MAPTAATAFPANVPVPSDRPDFLVKEGGDEAPMKSVPSNFIRDEDERPTVAYNEFSKDIPVISLTGIDGTEESRSRVREAVTSACEEWGIFQIIDHGVPEDLVADMHRLSKEFFALPVDEKLLYDMRKEGSRGGLVVSSHLKGEATLDYREIFTYFSYPQRLRDYSRWPGKPEGWKSTVELYSEALMGLACKLLGLLAEALGLETEALTEACVEMDQKVVINYYPTCPEPDKCLGLKRHTDPGTITLLLQDLVGGLQATKDNGQTWITVEPIEGAFVVNLGDHMQFLSNGRFKSADHQAVVNSKRSRLSIATFQNPAQNATVYPLPGVMKEGEQCILGEPITFNEMYKRKMSRDIEEARKKKLAKQNLLDNNITDVAPSQ